MKHLFRFGFEIPRVFWLLFHKFHLILYKFTLENFGCAINLVIFPQAYLSYAHHNTHKTVCIWVQTFIACCVRIYFITLCTVYMVQGFLDSNVHANAFTVNTIKNVNKRKIAKKKR